jgi:hypothetical protein
VRRGGSAFWKEKERATRIIETVWELDTEPEIVWASFYSCTKLSPSPNGVFVSIQERIWSVVHSTIVYSQVQQNMEKGNHICVYFCVKSE